MGVDHRGVLRNASTRCLGPTGLEGAPCLRRVNLHGVARCHENLEAKGLQVGAFVALGRPPFETSFGEAFVTEPKTLSVVNQNFDARLGTVAEDEHCAGKRVLIELILADAHQSIDAFAKVDGLVSDQQSHVRSDLNHR